MTESKAGTREHQQIYGSMVSVFETGVLLLGESGVGKSETSLELISRGHSLVADDAVLFTRMPNVHLIGTAPEMTARLLEIRGLGIIDVVGIFGESAYTKNLALSICVELRTPDKVPLEDRLDAPHDYESILGTKIRKFVLPVRKARNIPVFVETAVKIHLAGLSADQTANKLMDRYDKSVRMSSSADKN